MTVTRFAAVLASALVYAAAAGAANAGDGWRIVESAGAVKVGGAAFLPVAVTRNQVLPSDSWIETAASGRVVLMRGAESIAVGPNSRVYLPDEEVNGNTQVLQTLGSALYQIGKQKAPHFQVDTPYLAAVVKGTTFTVNVGERTTSVDVTEGVVEVATPDRGDVEYVRAGFTGLVSRDERGDVVVAPTEDSKSPAKKSSKDKSAQSGRIVIPAAIGDTSIDIKEASGGLASGVVEQGPKSSIQEAGEIGKDRTTVDAANVGGGASGVVKAVDVVSLQPAAVDVDVGVAAPAIDVGGSVGADVGVVDLGGGNGVGSGNGGVGLGLGVGTGNGNGNGLGLGVGVGVGGGGLSLGVGNGGATPGLGLGGK